MPLHNTWLSCGKDLTLHRFELTSRKELLLHTPVKLHNDEITDIVEIELPQKCIVTCSPDKKIIMYSLQRNEILRVFPQHNKTSVRRMVYFEHYGRYLLSAGSE
jgi:hypothetical protein